MEIEESVKHIVSDQLGVPKDHVVDSAEFVKDLGADSLDTVELVMALEEQFGIDITDGEAEHIQTVGAAVEVINTKVQASVAASNPG